MSLFQPQRAGCRCKTRIGQPGSAPTRRTAQRAALAAFGVAVDRRDGDHGLTGTICDRPGRCEPLTALRPRLDTVLDQIRAAMPPGAHVLVTGYWNVFLDGQVGAAKGTAYVANSEALTRAVNADLAAAAADTGMHYVDLYTPFKGDGSRDDTSLLAPDGDHPNAAGHQVIATAVLKEMT